MKNIRMLFLSLFLCVAVCSCDKEYNFSYQAVAQSSIGKQLVEGTELFASIYSDSTYMVVDGVEATHISYLSMKGLAMKMFIFKVDLSNPSISIVASTPDDKSTYAMQVMTKQAVAADRSGQRVWAGVNADFFNMSTGVPRGVLYKKGVAIKTVFDSGERGFFAIDKDKKAFVAASGQYTQIAATGIIQEAVGASVMLVSDGTVLKGSNTTVEPRTCIGVSKDGNMVYIMVVDGRNFWYSNGMTFAELGECMVAMGAHNAINLDGGGSSTFLVRATTDMSVPPKFNVCNWPTDNGGVERPVATGLLIVSDK